MLGTLFGVAIQGLIQTYINFDGTLSSWWTKIAIGILLFILLPCSGADGAVGEPSKLACYPRKHIGNRAITR